MAGQPYVRFPQEEMILRDYLAVDRTSLANERTFMSYIRTALAFGISGASAIHFLDGVATEVLGAVLIGAGALTFAVGAWRYVWYKRRVQMILGKAATPRKSGNE